MLTKLSQRDVHIRCWRKIRSHAIRDGTCSCQIRGGFRGNGMRPKHRANLVLAGDVGKAHWLAATEPTPSPKALAQALDGAAWCDRAYRVARYRG